MHSLPNSQSRASSNVGVRLRSLLDEIHDAPIPLATRSGQPTAGLAAEPRDRVVPLERVSGEVIAEAVAWLGSPDPSWGWRRGLLLLTGINLGPARRELRLRALFLALYQHSHDHEGGVS